MGEEHNNFPLEFEPVLAAAVGAGSDPGTGQLGDSSGASPSLAGGPLGLCSPCHGCHYVQHFPSREQLKDPLVECSVAS